MADSKLAALEETVRAKRSYIANALQGFDSLEEPLELVAEPQMEKSTAALARGIATLGAKTPPKPPKQAKSA